MGKWEIKFCFCFAVIRVIINHFFHCFFFLNNLLVADLCSKTVRIDSSTSRDPECRISGHCNYWLVKCRRTRLPVMWSYSGSWPRGNKPRLRTRADSRPSAGSYSSVGSLLYFLNPVQFQLCHEWNVPQIKLQGTRDGFNVPVAAVEVHVSRVCRVCNGGKTSCLNGKLLIKLEN